MNIPSSLMVDGVPWTIEECDTVPETEFGETRNKDCRVLLDSDVCKPMRELTFWHELIHVLFMTRDFKLNPEGTPAELEEQVASFLGPALHSFFKANAEIEWLD